MLRQLNIQNYALIEQTEITFGNGFSIITGQTGAGKSILLDALGLLLGNRADSAALRDKTAKCVVEAQFDIAQYNLEPLFQEQEVDYDAQTIVRREILPSGKSRAFINDQPVALTALKEIMQTLLDIHSQHQNLLLAKEQFRLDLVDTLAKPDEQLKAYRQTFAEYSHLTRERDQLVEQNKTLKRDLDYLRFQLQELDKLDLKPGEAAELEAEGERLDNAEDIRENATFAENALNAEDGILSRLHELKSAAAKLEQFLPEGTDALARIEQARIDLQDLGRTVAQTAESLEADPDRQAWINQRLNSIYSLQQKHLCQTPEGLIGIREDLKKRVSSITNFDEQLAEMDERISATLATLTEQADQLTGKREAVFAGMSQYIEANLQSMGIKTPLFRALNRKGQFTANGRDNIQLLFSANKAGEPQDIAKIASGGEIARVMLALKALICREKQLPTIIFDEIDTGVSGEVADSMGSIMRRMSATTQVLAITHLPQVAAKGQAHYQVFKDDEGEATTSHIRLLTAEERVAELAKMLSGRNVTDAALQNARQLLEA